MASEMNFKGKVIHGLKLARKAAAAPALWAKVQVVTDNNIQVRCEAYNHLCVILFNEEKRTLSVYGSQLSAKSFPYDSSIVDIVEYAYACMRYSDEEYEGQRNFWRKVTAQKRRSS